MCLEGRSSREEQISDEYVICIQTEVNVPFLELLRLSLGLQCSRSIYGKGIYSMYTRSLSLLFSFLPLFSFWALVWNNKTLENPYAFVTELNFSLKLECVISVPI